MKLKNIILSLLIICFCTSSFAQNFSKLKSIPLNEKKDFSKAEKEVSACCKYLLSTPISENSEKRRIATNFLFQWMEGTPDYTFDMDESVMNLSQINQALVPVYMAAVTQYTLTHKLKKSDKKVKEYAIRQISIFCENRKNGVEMTDELRNWLMKYREDVPLQLI